MNFHDQLDEARQSTIIVTGASRGLGRGIALELASSGYSIAVVFGKNREEADRTLALCESRRRSEHQRFKAFKIDISSADDRARGIAEIFEECPKVEGLVNNAGMAPRARADILDTSIESYEEVMRTNAEGPFFFTQLVVRRWMEEGQRATSHASATTEANPPLRGKRIVFITSISSETVSLNRGEYCMSKSALSMAASLWASRLAPEGGLVVEIRPGIMKTDMTKGVEAKYQALIAQGLVPARRWGSPEDVGRSVRAIMSGDCDFASGSVIHLDGGFHISRL